MTVELIRFSGSAPDDDGFFALAPGGMSSADAVRLANALIRRQARTSPGDPPWGGAAEGDATRAAMTAELERYEFVFSGNRLAVGTTLYWDLNHGDGPARPAPSFSGCPDAQVKILQFPSEDGALYEFRARVPAELGMEQALELANAVIRERNAEASRSDERESGWHCNGEPVHAAIQTSLSAHGFVFDGFFAFEDTSVKVAQTVGWAICHGYDEGDAAFVAVYEAKRAMCRHARINRPGRGPGG